MQVSELCREHVMSSASFYKWQANFVRISASLIAEMKDLAEQNQWLKRLYAKMSSQNDLLKEALGNKRSHLVDEMAMNAVMQQGSSIALACCTFQISETCYR